jgi:hypothetical protein
VKTSARRSLSALVAFASAATLAAGCAMVSGLNGLALDPQCGDSCASDGGGAGPADARNEAADGATLDSATLTSDSATSTSDSATSTSDSATLTSDSSAAPTDGGADAGEESGLPAGEIRCGAGGPCTAGPDECCMSSASPPTLSCSSATSSARCPNGTEIKCDDPSDCSGGDACCLQVNSSGYILQTVCQTACSGTGWYELCAPAGTCSAGTCSALTVLPNPPLTPAWFTACQ